MSQNRIDKAISECDAAVLRRLRQYDAEVDFARAEAYQMTAADRAEMNSVIDEQRAQDELSDLDYADRMLERLDERRNDA